MGLRHFEFLEGEVYSCKRCGQHLTTHKDLISKSFKGSKGAAYLFKTVVNIQEKDIQVREMTTGKHRVCDISCKACEITLGWKYVEAYEKMEKYKENHFILEKFFIVW